MITSEVERVTKLVFIQQLAKLIMIIQWVPYFKSVGDFLTDVYIVREPLT